MQTQLLQAPPARGGEVYERPYINVVFQRGLPHEVGVNGCRVDDVISAALDRLAKYQDGPLACIENDEAAWHLRMALTSLNLRLRRRMEQGVLNTMARHDTVRTEDENDDFSATGA